MAVHNTDFAVDMTPEGINLWQRGPEGAWLGLGYAPANDSDFRAKVEDLRQTASQPSTQAEVRIPASDVFVAQIRADEVVGPVTKDTVHAALAGKLPFGTDASDLCLDICHRGSRRISVAMTPYSVLRAANDAASALGFIPSYFTCTLDPMQFPRPPKFQLTDVPTSIPAIRASTNRTLKLALAAGASLCVLGGLLLWSTINSVPDGPEIMATNPSGGQVAIQQPTVPDGKQSKVAKIKPPTEDVAALVPLTNPLAIKIDTAEANTPLLQAAVLATPAPQALARSAIETPQIENDEPARQENSQAPRLLEQSKSRESLFNRNANSTFSQVDDTPRFGAGGLTLQGQTLLDNSVGAAQQSGTGTGAKTIRVLPAEADDGAWNSRFDPSQFVRVAQAGTATDVQTEVDASDTIIPLDKDAELQETTASGTRIFTGPPTVVPPTRTDQSAQITVDTENEATGTAAATDTDETATEAVDISEFTEEIERVLEGSPTGDAVVEAATAAIEAAVPALEPVVEPATPVATVTGPINTPDASTPRPRPRPASLQSTVQQAQTAAQTALTGTQSGQPIRRATASTVRPKPRPIGMDKTAEALAVEQAVTAAIAAGTGTSQAVFISRIPKARPAHMRDIVDRTKASLTLSTLGPNARVRTAPKGVEKGSNELSNSNTSKSVAALATERARLSKSSMNLIGVYGTASSRRALLRLGSGRYVKVKAGDKVSGWKISAIGESSVRIAKGKRNQVLRMPE